MFCSLISILLVTEILLFEVIAHFVPIILANHIQFNYWRESSGKTSHSSSSVTDRIKINIIFICNNTNVLNVPRFKSPQLHRLLECVCVVCVVCVCVCVVCVKTNELFCQLEFGIRIDYAIV